MKTQRHNRTPKTGSNPPAPIQSEPGGAAKVSKPKAAGIEVLEQMNLHAAGIDVGSAQNFVCVPAQAVKSANPMCVRLVRLPKTWTIWSSG